MRRLLVGMLVIAASAATASTAFAEPQAGATYKGKSTRLTTNADGTEVSIYKLPIYAKCTKAPSNLRDFGSSGLGPFAIKGNGTFTNHGPRRPPGSVEFKGTFSDDGTVVKGTVSESAFKDSKGFNCKKFSGKFTAKVKTP